MSQAFLHGLYHRLMIVRQDRINPIQSSDDRPAVYPCKILYISLVVISIVTIQVGANHKVGLRCDDSCQAGFALFSEPFRLGFAWFHPAQFL